MLRIAAAVALGLLATSPALADWDKAALDKGVAKIERRAKGRLGVALIDLKDHKLWSYRGAETFPMQSVFKLPLAVAVLQQVEAGKLRLDQPVSVTRKDLSLFHSPLARQFKGESATYPVQELIRLAAGMSDNTAADRLMREIGGPQVVTAMLRAGGVQGLSVDRYERQFQPEIYGLEGFGWGELVDEQRFRAELRALKPGKRLTALAEALKDKRDASTPEASARFLEGFAEGNWLRDPAHTAFLTKIITETPIGADRIKAGLPAGSTLAHRTGAGLTTDGINHATNDIGIAALPDGRRFVIAIYLAGSRVDANEREAALAEVAKLAVSAQR
ncbi:class A beta-lactamase [Bosea sp. (in: a-proteobacteria)]|uniref:class A beta-lactamase n=1 Tax=Bosea sp. (in: a-proteobacteria) TaxID=1871050 RepID=UPI0012096827|nr:class A beta-lactamase [Bosea sp. (in: a-proteobacteria)]TAJ34445.1 MAG: class A beta-lactamase [Bosea sp. (in: a-proteobacteria)]